MRPKTVKEAINIAGQCYVRVSSANNTWMVPIAKKRVRYMLKEDPDGWSICYHMKHRDVTMAARGFFGEEALIIWEEPDEDGIPV